MERPSGLLHLCHLLCGLSETPKNAHSPRLQVGRQTWCPWLCMCTPDSPDSRFLGHIWPAVPLCLPAPAPRLKSPIWAMISASYCILHSSVYKTSRKQTDRGAYIYDMKIMSLKCKKKIIVIIVPFTGHLLDTRFGASRGLSQVAITVTCWRGHWCDPHLTDEETEAQRGGVTCPNRAVFSGVGGTQVQ